MDHNNLTDLKDLRTKAIKQANGRNVADLQLFDHTQAVADPYYGDEQDFEVMFSHLKRVADQWIKAWQ